MAEVAASVAPAVRGWPRGWTEALMVLASAIGVSLLCLAALALAGAPATLPAGWAAAALLVVPLVRHPGWPVRLAAGAWLLASLRWSEVQSGHEPTPWPLQAVYAALLLAQATVVARGAARILRELPGDPRPLHVVRFVHLVRLIFAETLPVCAAVAVATALLWRAGGLASPAEALRLGLLHGGCAALLHVALTPALWWKRLLRGAPAPRLALLAAAAALPVFSRAHGELFWLAPLLMVTTGLWGGITLAGAVSAVLGASLLVQVQWHELMPFEGPDGFAVWLLTMWRLTLCGLVAGLFADRRRRRPDGSAPRRAACERGLASLLATLAAEADPQRPMVVVWGRWSPLPPTLPEAARIAAADSLVAVAALQRMARTLRPGDRIACFGHDELVLLLPGPPAGRAPAATSLQRRLSRASGLPVQLHPPLLRAAVEVRRMLETAGRHGPDGVVAIAAA